VVIANEINTTDTKTVLIDVRRCVNILVKRKCKNWTSEAMDVRLTNERGAHLNKKKKKKKKKKITNKRKKRSFDLTRDQLILNEIGPEFKIDFTQRKF